MSLRTFLAALTTDYLKKYFKLVYLTCANVLVSLKVNIQWWRTKNLANIVKMPVNGVPWSLLSKCLKCASAQVPWVLECLKCHSASSTRVSWVAEDPSTYIPANICWSWRRLQDISWRCLKDMSWRCLEDILETNKVLTGDICTLIWV